MNFVMQMPTGLAEAIGRRHHGRKLPPERVVYLSERMEMLYTQYKKAVKSLDTLDKYWDTAKVEDSFMRPKWYNAHSRLKRYRKALHANHESMFYLLLEADGNSGESFSPHHCISADEIYEDFKRKYRNKSND